MKIVGHRGGRGISWPTENSIPAFEQAINEGAHAIELDVRTCADDIVVLHDGTINHSAVSERTVEELRTIAPYVPTLDDVLQWARGRCSLNVEVKADVPDRFALARGVAHLLWRYPGVEVLLSSFDPVLLAMLATITPYTRRALITDRDQNASAYVAALAPIFAVHLERTQVTRNLISILRRAGKRVGVWTVNDPEEARHLEALGVDWIITDEPGAIQ